MAGEEGSAIFERHAGCAHRRAQEMRKLCLQCIVRFLHTLAAYLFGFCSDLRTCPESEGVISG
jgi:hypothetical protein